VLIFNTASGLKYLDVLERNVNKDQADVIREHAVVFTEGG